jgi:hypothetical protein
MYSIASIKHIQLVWLNVSCVTIFKLQSFCDALQPIWPDPLPTETTCLHLLHIYVHKSLSQYSEGWSQKHHDLNHTNIKWCNELTCMSICRKCKCHFITFLSSQVRQLYACTDHKMTFPAYPWPSSYSSTCWFITPCSPRPPIFTHSIYMVLNLFLYNL